MKLIRNAIVFNAEMPTAHDLATKIEALPFTAPAASDMMAIGFIPVPVIGEFVASYTNGYAFAVRIDEKTIPASAIKQRLKEWVARIEEAEVRKVGNKERRTLKDSVIQELLVQAIAKTSEITVFYDRDNQYLIVPVSSQRNAQRIMSALVKALETLKTSTIHVNNLTRGITALLKKHMGGDQAAFAPYYVGDHIQLQRTNRGKVTFSLTDATDQAAQGFIEALDAGFEVNQIQLLGGGTKFKLSSDFHLKAINF